MSTSRFCMLGAAWLYAALWWMPEATAQIVWPQPILTQVVSGLSDPVHIAHAGDGSGRLFIVERAGRIRIYQNGSLLSTPFLSITTKTSTGGERGLLSVAFPSNYEATGSFYVFYTNTGGDLIVARYQVTTTNPNLADPASETILLNIEHSGASNHNGGQLAFSPTDGYLYISTGDGGNTPAEGQNLSGLLGKLLRIDVESGAVPYAIPPDNPFLLTSGARDEIWARGLRNPWRFSFDQANGDLYLADVGQASWEEVDVQRDTSAGGENYGWNIMEGLHCDQPGCSPTGLTLPVLEYSSAGSDCAIMGGVVYRGAPFPRMQGVYFYADYCTGKIWGLKHDGSAWQSSLLTTFNQQFALTSFGEGEDGSIYFTDSPNGAIYRITDNVATTADLRVTLAASPSPATVGQPFSLTATVTNLGGATATGVNLTETLATGPIIGSITPSQGSCSRVNQAVTCVLGTLNNGASATVAIVVTPTVAGTLINQATVAAVESDPQTGNNTQQTPTTVNPLTPPPSGSDLSVTQLGTPNPVVAGNALTVTVVVGNSGPDPATGVVLTDELPAGATLVSATTTSGVCSGTAPVICTIGGLTVGGSVTATIVVAPGTAGTATNTVQVSAGQTDPSLENNAATFDVTVVEPSAQLTLATGPQLPSTGSDASTGDTNVPMLQFSFTSGAEAVTLDAVALAASGSGDDAADVQAIRLVLDTNDNGVVDQGEPTLGNGSFGTDNGLITVAFALPHTIPGSTSETYLIVYDFAAVRGAALPVSAGLMVLALAGVLRVRRFRQAIVLLIAGAGLCWVAGCNNGDESSGTPPVIATTYQLSLTGVTAHEESSGGPVAISGLPLAGPVVTVR